MDKRNKVFFYSFLCVFIFAAFASCQSTGSIIHNKGAGTTEIRNAVSQLAGQQAESAGAVEKIAAGNKRIESGLTEAIGELETGAQERADFDTICKRIRERIKN